jgi:hypothetical protein
MEVYGLLTSDARKLFAFHTFGRSFEVISNYDKMVHTIKKIL